jgi:hypothetical protein
MIVGIRDVLEITGPTEAAGIFYNQKSNSLEIWKDGEKWGHLMFEYHDKEKRIEWLEWLKSPTSNGLLNWEQHVIDSKKAKEKESQVPVVRKQGV